MKTKKLLGDYLVDFLKEEMIEHRNMSLNTVKSYRDTFMLLLNYFGKEIGKDVLELEADDFTSEYVKNFLAWLDKEKHSSAVTCNQRLAAIKSFSKYLIYKCPETLKTAMNIFGLKVKKALVKTPDYLDRKEMEIILDVPNRETFMGLRNYTLLLFMYNTGARASEVSNVKRCDIKFIDKPFVRLLGKGNKTRLCPLWERTIIVLQKLTSNYSVDMPYVFYGERKNHLSRHGIYEIVESTMKKAQAQAPQLKNKKITPHSIRHSTAVELLCAGVDINTIRSWLGHVSIATTNIYATINLEMKAKAISKCSVNTKETKPMWKEDTSFLAQMKKL